MKGASPTRTFFDIREFHDRIVRVSSYALPVIEQEIHEWIRAEAGPAAP